MTVELILLLLGGYVLGAIPFGVLVARAKGIDIMSVGSGNTGATNVMRVLGKGPGFLVFFLDTLKGLLPVLVARWLFPHEQPFWLAAGAVAIIGHSFSPFLKFKGGKGIATALGMMIGTSPIVALIAFVLFAIVLTASRYMSLASIVAVLSTIPFGLLMKDSPWVIGGYVVLSSMIIWRHRANILRLKSGTEPKFAFRKTIDAAPEKPAPESATAEGPTSAA
jgi:glycerol-3-phosphate acyltransferase PlsY